MFEQYIFSNLNFLLTVFSALVFFAGGWLYFDSWSVGKDVKTPLIRSLGFLQVALAFALQAPSIENFQLETVSNILKIVGLVSIFLSLSFEPILPQPGKQNNADLKLQGLTLTFPKLFIPVSAFLFVLISIIYFRKATRGLEKQIKPAAVAFLLLGISELLNISLNLIHTEEVFWSSALSEFGSVWIISRIFEFLGSLILGLWILGYLRFRLQAQLFILTTTASFIIFLLSTFLFSFILLKNLENDALEHLKTDVRVLDYALERLKSEALTNARGISQDSQTREALASKNFDKLFEQTSQFLLKQKTSFLQITSPTGEVVMRAENRDKVGDNLTFDPAVRSATSGFESTSVTIRDGAIAPEVQIRAASPIKNEATGSAVLGTVVTGFNIDSAFVDGVKKVTELESSVFAKNTRAATTQVATDGKSRFIGTEETNEEILSTVLGRGEIFVGSSQILNQPFYSVYSPLKDSEDNVVGMLSVAKPQTTLIAAAQKSLQLTFLGSVGLMIVSTIPAYFFSKFLRKQIEA